jgi:hypothetical protein
MRWTAIDAPLDLQHVSISSVGACVKNRRGEVLCTNDRYAAAREKWHPMGTKIVDAVFNGEILCAVTKLNHIFCKVGIDSSFWYQMEMKAVQLSINRMSTLCGIHPDTSEIHCIYNVKSIIKKRFTHDELPSDKRPFNAWAG